MTTEQETQEQKELDTVSEDTESVSEEEEPKEEGEAEAITFKTQEEFDTLIRERTTAEANRIANKSTATLQSDNDKLKSENAHLKRQVEYKTEDDKLAKLEQAEQAQWEESENVKELQDVRREVIKLGRENKVKEQELIEKEENLTQVGLRQSAFEKALKLFLPEDKEFLSEVEDFASKLQEAKTEREMNLIYGMEEARIKAKAEAPPKQRPTPTDTNIPTVPGGKDLSQLSARELLELGFSKKK